MAEERERQAAVKKRIREINREAGNLKENIKTYKDSHPLETRPESQLAGFITAPERRNTVVNEVFVHATRFNHP